MFIQDRASARNFFVTVWRKRQAGLPLEPMEMIVADVIGVHPKYHGILVARESALNTEFGPEMGHENPYLHMGLHIALREQVGADRPCGIAALYRAGLLRFGDAHGLEHRMMDCLADALWTAQRFNGLPDERRYLECLKHL
jgi:hypothetical protein